jgi:hypothetical protein
MNRDVITMLHFDEHVYAQMGDDAMPSLEGSIAASASACGYGCSVALAAGLYVAVRDRPRGSPRPRTHSGQRRHAETGPVVFG